MLLYLGWNNHWCWIETGLNLRRIRLHRHLRVPWASVHVWSRLVSLVRHTSSSSTTTSAASSASVIIVASSMILEATYLVILLIVVLLWNSLTHWALSLRKLIRRIRLSSSHLEDATNELVNLLILFPLLLLLLFFF